MNKQELIDTIFAHTGFSKVQINKTIDVLLATIKKAVVEGDLVQLISFGSFKAGERAARMGRNPKTGELLEIPSVKTVKFTPGKDFKEDLNRK